MSMKTWLKEFYPITAKEAAKKGLMAALKHCLKKWSGLTKAALNKHDIIADCGGAALWDDVEDKATYINGYTCALCQLYFDQAELCKGCPLAYRDEEGEIVSCCDEGEAYDQWVCGDGCSAMLKELRKAIAKLKATNAKRAKTMASKKGKRR